MDRIRAGARTGTCTHMSEKKAWILGSGSTGHRAIYNCWSWDDTKDYALMS